MVLEGDVVVVVVDEKRNRETESPFYVASIDSSAEVKSKTMACDINPRTRVESALK